MQLEKDTVKFALNVGPSQSGKSEESTPLFACVVHHALIHAFPSTFWIFRP